ncbi:MAG: alpha/beta fold hydrolase [Planctomycetes bacterium]|jgi:pimeloyl-ACP methyl ester carboxylesterase|nr:alpha/beta fold hydrolase [Planctomycetota bacterium]
MPNLDPSDPDWSQLRSAFEALVELAPAEQMARIDGSGLSPLQRQKLRRLLRHDHESGSWLQPGQAIDLPSPSREFDAAPGPSLPRQLGRYRLLESIGKGGMGEVFRARDTALERDVAVKLLSPTLLADPQWLPRFRREARAAGGLNHPNVLTVHDVGECQGEHFLVTELVHGQTLRQRLGRGGMPWAELIDCACQITEAVTAAHAAGIVHRDLKPENVMLRPDGLLKVLDFGLAKQQAPALPTESDPRTAAGMLVGSVRYMSPEQARGGEVDERSDVFGLGVLCYELATGTPAFGGATPLDVLMALLEREPPALGPRRGDLPPAFAELVAQAMRKQPDERLPTARALLAGLEALRVAPAVAAAPAFEMPAVRYAQSGAVNIAYQVIGNGPLDLVFVMGWISHLEWFWREPSFARFLRRLATFARVILFDKRGTGLSDRVATDRLPTLEQRMDDVRAVLDEVGSERAVLCGISEGGPMCALFAASRPERVRGLVMIGSYARRLRGEGYPWGSSPEARERFCDEIQRSWGGPVGIAERAPSRADDAAFRDWWAAYLRHGASPSAAIALTRMNAEIDVRPVLPTIAVPTLVIHRTGDRCLGIEEGRYLARSIPGARLVELPGSDHLPFVGDQDAVLAAIGAFLAEPLPTAVPASALVTLVRAAVVAGGDPEATRRWRQSLLQEPQFEAARSLLLHDGELLAVFDGPERALRAAAVVMAAAAAAPCAVRAVVHVGLCQRGVAGVNGAVVDESEPMLRAAAKGELLASAAVRDLVAGSGFRFGRAVAVEWPSGGSTAFAVQP